jgi:hypothetical protein
MYDRIKILIVTDNIDVNNGSGAKANVAIIQNLSSSGFDITVCHHTGYKHELEGIRTELVRIKKVNILYLIYGLTRWVNQHFKYNLNRVIEKYMGFPAEFFNTAKSIRKHIRKKHDVSHFDMVITLSKGTSFRPHYALLGMPEWHTKWMAYIHDPYPYHLYPRPYQFRPIGELQKERFFRKMSKAARWFGFPSKLLQEWMGYDFPEMNERGVVIPHQLTPYHPPAVSLDAYLKPGKMTFVHAGNLMEARTPLPLIKAFSRLMNSSAEAAQYMELVLVGSSDFSQTELATASNNIPQIRFELHAVPFHIAYQLQQQASVNIIIEANGHISPFLPGKFPHCVAANKPILLLSPYYSETRNLLGKDYAYWSETDDEEKIYAVLVLLLSNWRNNIHQELENYKSLREYLTAPYLLAKINSLLTN